VHEGSRKAIAAAFVANLGIAIAKFAAFAITGAASLLAEAIHSVADTGNQGLLFLGGRRAQKPATRLHPFGYGRERYFWAFVVALVLFSLGAVFATVEGVEKLIHPHAIEDPLVAYVVLLVAIALEAFSFRTAIREAAKVRHRHSWWQFIRAAKSPELPVVLLEDFGALIGLFFALAGITLSEVTGEPAFDALGSIAIGLLLGVIAAPAEEQAIVDTIEADPDVERLIHLRTQHLGPEELLVAAKVELGPETMSRLGAAIDDLERRIRGAVPTARVIYIEPDEYRPGAAADDDDPE
jgi:cation diffusion facilitator family transporter